MEKSKCRTNKNLDETDEIFQNNISLDDSKQNKTDFKGIFEIDMVKIKK
jgi:hypothetical protein